MAHQNPTEPIPDKDTALENYISLLPLLSQSTHDYLFFWDIYHEQIYFASEILKHYDLPKDQTGYSVSDWLSIVYPPDRKRISDDLAQIVSGEKTEHHLEYRLINHHGEKIWINCCGKVFLGDLKTPIMVGRVSEKALTCRPDLITGLLNQRQMYKDLNAAIESNQHGYLFVLGIDNFKDINDKHGRDFGNDILKQIAAVLETYLKLPNLIYRFDGDKFGILISDKDRLQTEQIYQTLRAEIQDRCGCTVSAGIVSFPFQNADTCQLYQYAEDALNHAKKQGKDCFCFFSMKDYQNRLLQLELETELKSCIEEDFRGFYVAYQPQIHAQDGTLAGAEALMRWKSETRGVVSPEILIPILEQTGLIVKAGDWILKTALSQCKKWRETIPNFHISVNLSYNQLFTNKIVNNILHYLNEYNLPGEVLVLELTESIRLQNYTDFNGMFYQLGVHGVQVSIDDFGTGYSSLGYLKHLSVDEIKIDRCFVQQIESRKYNYRLIKTMIELAKTIHIQVCVEGVETLGEMLALSELKPDLIQGYFFGRPEPAETFNEQFILAKNTDRLNFFNQTSRYCLDPHEQEQVELAANFRDIVEGLDEIVYISDPENYTLYYLNRGGRRLIGVDDYEGQLCYKVLQNRDTPCEFCTSKLLRRRESHVWEYYNPFLKRRFLLKDKLISWNGKSARLEIAIDITHKEQVQEQTQKKLSIEHILVTSAHQLMNSSDLQTAVGQSLQLLAEFYQADRAYIFEIDHTNKICSNSYEWCSPGISPQKEHLQQVSLNKIRYLLNKLSEEQTTIVHDANHSSNKSFSEYFKLKDQTIQRFAISPFYEERQIVAFVGMDNPSSSDISDCTLLKSITCFLVNEIRKRRLSERLYKMSYYDALTEVYNRNRYIEDIAILSERKPSSMGVVFADINSLKKINDERGHEQGDRLIRYVADQLKFCFPENQIYRIGGDEFVVLCKAVSQQRFQRQVDALIASFSMENSPMISIGRVWMDSNVDIQKMVHRADKLMYSNKQNYYRSNLQAELGIS